MQFKFKSLLYHRQYKSYFSNQSSETRGKQLHDITSIRRFISDKQHSVISVFVGRNVIAQRLFELLIF